MDNAHDPPVTGVPVAARYPPETHGQKPTKSDRELDMAEADGRRRDGPDLESESAAPKQLDLVGGLVLRPSSRW